MKWINAEHGTACRLEVSDFLEITVSEGFTRDGFVVRCGKRRLTNAFLSREEAKETAESWVVKVIADIAASANSGVEFTEWV